VTGGTDNSPRQGTTAENPWPVRTVARKIAEWINRLGTVWVEGQLTQISARPGTSTAFLTLRDTDLDMSLPVSAATRVLDGTCVPAEQVVIPTQLIVGASTLREP